VETRGKVINGLYVETHGEREGPPVLMSPGLGGGGLYWTPQIAAFAASHFLILYDHRGTARSDRSQLPASYDVAHLAADIGIILDGLGLDTAHIIGHAAGGIAGLSFAARSPERLKSLTVVNGWVRASRHFRRCMDVRRSIFTAGGADAYLKAQPIYLYPAEWIDQNLDHLDADRMAQAGSFPPAETLFARMAALERFDLHQERRTITTPTLLVASNDDALVPASASSELAKTIPGARLVQLTSGGHAINVTRPETFNSTVLSFLQNVAEIEN
jgi:aminoacrylate hydrolase